MSKKKAKQKFTIKQQRFIDSFDGNATEAARKAGYKGNEATLAQVGAENLRKPYITKAIEKREQKRTKGTIATREERQEFWTKVLLGKDQEPEVISYNSDGNAVIVKVPPKMSDRLKASELLGRSEADFTDKKIISDPDGKSLKWKVEIVKSKGK